MTDKHPITPSPSQLDQWEMVARATTDPSLLNEPAIRAGHFGVVHRKALRLAFAAGADQELEACCVEVSFWGSKGMAEKLRTARRLKPPSLKEQALAVLEEEPEDAKELIVFDTNQVNLIRRALEALPND